MKKVVIMAVVAFLLSLGGTTGALVAKGRAAAAADSVAADSTAADGAHAGADSTAEGKEGGAHHDGDSARGARGDVKAEAHPQPRAAAAHGEPSESAPSQPVLVSAGGETAATDSGAAALVEAHQPTHPDTSSAHAAANEPAPGSAGLDRQRESYRQLARIFANMKTADAVKVLGYMSDDEVQGVIEQLGVRQAAGLLAALPKERAAVLSRRLLQSGPPEKS